MPLVEDFVRQVGKENVEVYSLVPVGANPHTWEPAASSLNRFGETGFFFVNGLGLDTHIHDFIESNRIEEAYVVPFAPNVRSPQGGDLTAEQARDNSHLWLDPVLGAVYPEIIADTLDIYDGVNRQFYDANYAAYRQQVMDLAPEIQGQFASIPEARRKLITYHDSFAHFARRFKLEVSGFAVAVPGDQPAAGEIDRLAQVVRDQGILAVFAEYGYDSAPMQEIASKAGVPVCTLYSDVLGGEVDTYIEMMRANAAEIVRCLGGTATP